MACRVRSTATARPAGRGTLAAPTGGLNAYTVGASIARHMPQGAIVCDDSVTSGAGVAAAAATARPHEVLALTGGAIGIGLPLAIGAAVAAPDPVIAAAGNGQPFAGADDEWPVDVVRPGDSFQNFP